MRDAGERQNPPRSSNESPRSPHRACERPCRRARDSLSKPMCRSPSSGAYRKRCGREMELACLRLPAPSMQKLAKAGARHRSAYSSSSIVVVGTKFPLWQLGSYYIAAPLALSCSIISCISTAAVTATARGGDGNSVYVRQLLQLAASRRR